MENSYNKSIRDIDTIDSQDHGYNSEYAIVSDREDLRKIIEKPCLNACITLYDKNIRTVNSSANKREIGGQAYIGIDYDSLDENNKQILKKLIAEGIIEPLNLSDNLLQRGGREFFIKVPVNQEDTVGIVSDRFMKIATNFQDQDVLYGRYGRLELLGELLNMHADLFNIGEEQDESEITKGLKEYYELDDGEDLLTAVFGYVYDKDLDIYWHNQELYNKHQRYQERQKKETEKSEKVEKIE